jgi:serine phosphatase RsbU (regulator of sigma subunit)
MALTQLICVHLRILSAKICGKFSLSLRENVKTSLSLLVLISLPLFSYAQNSSSIQKLIDQGNEIYFSDPDSSYALCCEAEEGAKAISSNEHLGDIALCKGRYLILVTDYQAAGKELNTAIEFFSIQKDYVNLSRAYSLQSILLDRIGEPEESTKMLLEAYRISKDHGDRPGEISRLTNLTLDFIEQDQADSAYKYLVILQSLESDIEEEDRYFLEQNLGLYYHMTGDNAKAIYYYNRAREIADTYAMIDSKATILARSAEAYRELNMLSESEKAALLSYDLSVENKLVFEERDAIVELVATYEAMQNYKLAFDFRGKLIDVDDRINKLEKIQKLKEDEYKLSLSQKETELAQKELDIQAEQLKSAEAHTQNMILYFVVFLIVLVLTFTIVIYLRTRKLNRTIEISRIILEQKNREVLDSINYAKQIQDAILPPRKYYQDLLKEIFVFYRPKDIVAGDFYWLDKIEDNVFFAVADCTGHGVPGAMVSVICHSALNRSVKEFDLHTPAQILEKTSELVMETFVKSDREVKDGMDVALCVIDLKTNLLTFAGANNPVWIIKSKDSVYLADFPVKNQIVSDMRTLVELRGNKQPIGHFEKRGSFTNQQIQLEAGDTIYLSTDGYIDQFGGDKGKKFKSKFFKEKILQIQNNTLGEQNQMIVSVFDTWKGDLEQVDDVCVMGIRV